jgi:4-alpha-glucanotransferase
LFDALQKALDPAAKGLPIIAEDLGEITPQVEALRAAIGLPGMRILQFAFDGQSDNLYLPHNFEPNTVVYTGTHDNDTSRGWWATLAPQARDYICRYLGLRDGVSEAVDAIDAIHWVLIRAASASVASLSIIPLQDVLGLDANSRMNQPGEAEGYWAWRFSWNQVAAWHAERLGELCQLHGRLPKQPGQTQDSGRSHN